MAAEAARMKPQFRSLSDRRHRLITATWSSIEDPLSNPSELQVEAEVLPQFSAIFLVGILAYAGTSLFSNGDSEQRDEDGWRAKDTKTAPVNTGRQTATTAPTIAGGGLHLAYHQRTRNLFPGVASGSKPIITAEIVSTTEQSRLRRQTIHRGQNTVADLSMRQ